MVFDLSGGGPALNPNGAAAEQGLLSDPGYFGLGSAPWLQITGSNASRRSPDRLCQRQWRKHLSADHHRRGEIRLIEHQPKLISFQIQFALSILDGGELLISLIQ